MRKFKVTKYGCDFCGVDGENKKDVESHEKKCTHNPAKRACETCVLSFFKCPQSPRLEKNCPHWQSE